MERLSREFFENPAPYVARNLIGKYLCADIGGKVVRSEIVEAEAYLDERDSASHARFGPTKNGKMMWEEAGTIGIYLCYGLHFMLNITTGAKGEAQAVLIRGVEGAIGPGRVTKMFGVNMADNGHNVCEGYRIWIENGPKQPCVAKPRVGIDFARPKDKNRKLRFCKK